MNGSRLGRPTGATELGVGTAVFLPGYGVNGEGLTTAQPENLMEAAFSHGIRYIDTAAGYGSSEEFLGRISGLIDSHSVRISTKLSPGQVPGGVEASLERLQVAAVDTLLLHSATSADLLDDDVWEILTAARDAGLVRRLGASTYGVEDARLALERTWCDVVQVECSVLNPSVVDALAPGKRSEQEIVVRSVLAQGLLTRLNRPKAAQLGSRADELTAELEAQAVEWGMSLEQLAIRFALDHPAVDVVLVGVAEMSELEAAVSALRLDRLDAKQLSVLKRFDCSSEDWTHPERWTQTQ
jgi:aryl-alcohol dehydrogenase-like predicted oxidoreductase